MSKYSAIREQLRVEAGKKYQGQIESALGQIEREHLQDDFCEKYVQLQKVVRQDNCFYSSRKEY